METKELISLIRRSSSSTSTEVIEAAKEVLNERNVKIDEKDGLEHKADNSEKEDILYIIPKVSLLRTLWDYNLILTTNRLIFGRITSARQISLGFYIITFIIAQAIFRDRFWTGFPLFIAVCALIVGYLIGKLLQESKLHNDKTPTEILEMHVSNFDIPYRDIDYARLRKKKLIVTYFMNKKGEKKLKKSRIKVRKKYSDRLRLILNKHLKERFLFG